ncbi:hypothetical protein HU200_060898 [Digitaria exilis]|uniref:DUF1618 domain-containing protein n=1 Tax=Digitaria exilis TaxID=1010633 RepID=A0A835AIB4_9POAL|nr:hypothetical protein HU200_060898 [Digitaria exilis]
MDGFTPCLAPPSLPTAEEGSDLTPSSVLLDMEAYITAAAVSNATTAVGYMRTGKPIHITFYLAHPPRLSYLCAHFPGPAAANSLHPGAPAARCIKNPPIVISTHADLALLHITHPAARDLGNDKYHDYFVYTARPWGPSLHRLPYPHANAGFQDNEVAIFRCSGGGRYVIAALRNTCDTRKFRLQRYDSDTCRWTSTVLYVHAPVRDIVLPIPDTATQLIYHNTDKVIMLGGPRATIGWVDLWRGILLCDVLDQDKPRLRDVPLLKPSRAYRRYFCIGGPRPARDIAVVTTSPVNKVIKYIEMEIRPGEDLPPPRQSACDSDSDDDAPPHCHHLDHVITNWFVEGLQKDCKVDVTDILVKNQRQLQQPMLLPQLTTTDDPQNLTMRLRRLYAAHPTLGLADHGDLVIYFLSKANIMDNKGWVMAVGAMDKMLRGIAELDSRKNKHWMMETQVLCTIGKLLRKWRILIKADKQEGLDNRSSMRILQKKSLATSAPASSSGASPRR